MDIITDMELGRIENNEKVVKDISSNEVVSILKQINRKIGSNLKSIRIFNNGKGYVYIIGMALSGKYELVLEKYKDDAPKSELAVLVESLISSYIGNLGIQVEQVYICFTDSSKWVLEVKRGVIEEGCCSVCLREPILYSSITDITVSSFLGKDLIEGLDKSIILPLGDAIGLYMQSKKFTSFKADVVDESIEWCALQSKGSSQWIRGAAGMESDLGNTVFRFIQALNLFIKIEISSVKIFFRKKEASRGSGRLCMLNKENNKYSVTYCIYEME